jgi:hypothetical protein
MSGNRETRHYQVKEFRIKRDASGNVRLEGYAAVFDKPSEDMGFSGYEIREFIAPGAFDEVLKTSDCRAVFNHDPNMILGRQSAGTLELRADSRGLFIGIDMPKTSYANDLAVSVERGDVREQSFCFVVGADEWTEDNKNKVAMRTITKISKLFDVGPVTYPAYPDTDIAKRAFESFRGNDVNESEDLIKDKQRQRKYRDFKIQKVLS